MKLKYCRFSQLYLERALVIIPSYQEKLKDEQMKVGLLTAEKSALEKSLQEVDVAGGSDSEVCYAWVRHWHRTIWHVDTGTVTRVLDKSNTKQVGIHPAKSTRGPDSKRNDGKVHCTT